MGGHGSVGHGSSRDNGGSSHGGSDSRNGIVVLVVVVVTTVMVVAVVVVSTVAAGVAVKLIKAIVVVLGPEGIVAAVRGGEAVITSLVLSHHPNKGKVSPPAEASPQVGGKCAEKVRSRAHSEAV